MQHGPTHMHVDSIGLGIIQDTTARLTLAEQCRRLDGRTEERPAFFVIIITTQKKYEITLLKDQGLSQLSSKSVPRGGNANTVGMSVSSC